MHRDPKVTPTPYSAADFLPPEPAEDADDAVGDAEPGEAVAPPVDVGAAFGATERNVPLVMGHGGKLPKDALGAFFGKANE